jgi:hypothetical protein
MAEMGSYCKAYLAKQFRAFDGWKEDTSDLRKETQEEDGKEVEVQRDAIDDEDILYLQETYVVTDGIFKDENVVFDDVTDAWKTFCHDELEFEIPEYEPLPTPEGADAGDGDAAGA